MVRSRTRHGELNEHTPVGRGKQRNFEVRVAVRDGWPGRSELQPWELAMLSDRSGLPKDEPSPSAHLLTPTPVLTLTPTSTLTLAPPRIGLSEGEVRSATNLVAADLRLTDEEAVGLGKLLRGIRSTHLRVNTNGASAGGEGQPHNVGGRRGGEGEGALIEVGAAESRWPNAERFSSLLNLDAAYNEIGLSGAVAIADGLRHNRTLTQLDLSENRLCGVWREYVRGEGMVLKGERSDEGVRALCAALCSNESITSISLSFNHIDGHAARQLADAALESPSLRFPRPRARPRPRHLRHPCLHPHTPSYTLTLALSRSQMVLGRTDCAHTLRVVCSREPPYPQSGPHTHPARMVLGSKLPPNADCCGV